MGEAAHCFRSAVEAHSGLCLPENAPARSVGNKTFNVLGGIDTQEFTFAEEGNPPTQLFNFSHIMRGEQHGGLFVALEFFECSPGFLGNVWVKSNCTLI